MATPEILKIVKTNNQNKITSITFIPVYQIHCIEAKPLGNSGMQKITVEHGQNGKFTFEIPDEQLQEFMDIMFEHRFMPHDSTYTYCIGCSQEQ